MATLGATKGNYDADKPCTVTYVTELVSQDLGHFDVPFQIYFEEETTQEDDADGAKLLSFDLPIPDYVALEGWILNLTLQVRTNSAGNAASVRLANETDTENGDWVSTTDTGYSTTGSTVQVAIGAAADTDRLTTINVMGKIADAAWTCYVQSIMGLTAWFSET